MNNIKEKAQRLFSGKSKKLFWIGVVCLALILVTVALSAGDSKEDENVVSIQTARCTLEFPKEYSANLKHREVTEGDTAMEIFSMVSGETEMEMFRVYFGIPTQGNPVGYLDDMPVTVSVSQYNPEDFANEATRELYYTMITGINQVLDSLSADGRFRENQSSIVKSESSLTYWTVPLREGMTCEESTQGDTYRADFYGTVSGEKVHLYTIYLGESGAEAVLGSYQVDGTPKTVSVESYDLPRDNSWTEEEQYQAAAMMSTVNDVIRVIRESQGFSESLQ